MSNAELPAEVVAYFDGLCDGDPNGASIKPILMACITAAWPAMVDTIAKAIADEREACAAQLDAAAKDMDAHAAAVDGATDASAERTAFGFRTTAAAYRSGAMSLRARK